jgi:phosphoribosylamine---glycine ligase
VKILITGSGAREHALAWACARSPLVERVYVAPGNGGTGAVATNLPIAAGDPAGIVRAAEEQQVDLVVLGPEASVAAGVGNALRQAGIPCFGPDREPGRIETSKAFARSLMQQAGIPSPAFGIFTSAPEAERFILSHGGRVAVKADGLAQGKGVVLCTSVEEANQAVATMLVDRTFGDAGQRIVIEERLEGPELSLFAVTDGDEVLLLGCARDYKRANDGGRGPNTGGMGAYSPPVGVDDHILQLGLETVLRPAVRALANLGIPYRGALYAGLMLTPQGIRVIEFNARFGDPEAQVLLPRLRSDLVPLLIAGAAGELEDQEIEWDEKAAVGIVVASGGYPEAYRTGLPIQGIDCMPEGILVFHAGTKRSGSQLLTDGGRVLTVVAQSSSPARARQAALQAASQIRFSDAFWRHDIAAETESTMSIEGVR